MGSFIMMPKLGMTMTEGHITRWLVKEGQQIEKGDLLFEVETDKTTLEVDSIYSGVIRKLYYEAPVLVPVESPVAFIGTLDEAVPEIEMVTAGNAADAAPAQKAPAAGQKPPAATDPKPTAAVTQNPSASDRASYDYDLVTIGAGPGGYVAAIRAAQLGARVAVIEKDTCGGTCLNRGCIPTKALYSKAREWECIRDAGKHGFAVEKATFDWKKIMAHKDDAVKQLVKGVGYLLDKNGVKLIKGCADVKRPHEVTVGDKTITARYIVLATGSWPLAKISSESRLQNTDDILSLQTLPKKLAIIGGGVVGCEIAYIMNAFGVDVTVIEVMPRLLPGIDAEVSATLQKKLSASGIKIMTEAAVEKVTGQQGDYTVHIAKGDAIRCDLVLEAVGRQTDNSAFSELGVKLTQRGYIETDTICATSIEGVYAIGDCTGLPQLAHNASHQGIHVAEHLFGGVNSFEEQPVPVCIFSAMEVASVGKTLEEAKKAGIDAMEYKVPYVTNGKALAMSAKEGFVKVVADTKYGEILGVHIIGEHASSLVHEAVMAIRGELTALEAGHTIHVHPTLSEMLMEAFLGCSSGAINC